MFTTCVRPDHRMISDQRRRRLLAAGAIAVAAMTAVFFAAIIYHQIHDALTLRKSQAQR